MTARIYNGKIELAKEHRQTTLDHSVIGQGLKSVLTAIWCRWVCWAQTQVSQHLYCV